MRFIDLYCGAGLGARGAVAAGAAPALAVDNWDVATDTYKLNFPDAEVVQSPVEDLIPAEYKHIGEIDLILGSPECTAHSIARGTRSGSKASRDGAFQLLGWIDEFKPNWIVMENVTRLKAWPRLSEFKQSLAEDGYTVSQLILNSADFGVAQSRRRLFLVANRHGIEISNDDISSDFPTNPASTIIDMEGEWKSRRLYCKGRAEATKERAKRAIAALGRRVPFLVVYYGSDYAGGWQRLDVPLRTITTLDRFGLVTWEGNTPMLRMLQPPELLGAMGASQHLLSATSRRNKVKLCGNGICSPVVENIVRVIRNLDEDAKALTLRKSA